jgi:hypothetical protein
MRRVLLARGRYGQRLRFKRTLVQWGTEQASSWVERDRKHLSPVSVRLTQRAESGKIGICLIDGKLV